MYEENPPQMDPESSPRLCRLNPSYLAEASRKKNIPEYWGYDLRGSKGRLSDLVHSPEWDLTIATSKMGDRFIWC